MEGFGSVQIILIRMAQKHTDPQHLFSLSQAVDRMIKNTIPFIGNANHNRQKKALTVIGHNPTHLLQKCSKQAKDCGHVLP
jgi:hypothetical protein